MEVSRLYHNSRPEGELLAQESAAFDLLDSLGIDYDRVSHEPADTMEKCDAVAAVLGVAVCKNLFLCNRQKPAFYLLCMPPHKPFHTKDLSAQIGSARLSFAPEEQLWELLHCTPGSATVLGLMNDTEHQVRLLSIARPTRRNISPATPACVPPHSSSKRRTCSKSSCPIPATRPRSCNSERVFGKRSKQEKFPKKGLHFEFYGAILSLLSERIRAVSSAG